MAFPRILIIAMGRINASDTNNNGLLLRNLLGGDFPSENLGQIYSGGNNGDPGFCGHEYQIESSDRRFGKIFFKIKGALADEAKNDSFSNVEPAAYRRTDLLFQLLKKSIGRPILVSGLYELIFKVTPSNELVKWVEHFKPDVILAQGYNLSFTWLPLALHKRLNIPIAYYASDDWPSYLHSSTGGLCTVTAPLMQKIVMKAAEQLLAATAFPFAFNDLMAAEYKERYGKQFTTLMHCDMPERFSCAEEIRLYPDYVKSIVATGSFDDSRWPLLLDLEHACARFNKAGVTVRATIFATRLSENGIKAIKGCKYINIRTDPGHSLLPSYLKGADLLYLPETFDSRIAYGYRYSISTKAHLFMFSKKPIVVYGHPSCGVVHYAKNEKWAEVVQERNVDLLFQAFDTLLFDESARINKIKTGLQVAQHNNDTRNVRKTFYDNLKIKRA